MRLTHLGIVEELLEREGDKADRDSAIFTGAVIIYKRRSRSSFPSCLSSLRKAIRFAVRSCGGSCGRSDGSRRKAFNRRAAQRRQGRAGQLRPQL